MTERCSWQRFKSSRADKAVRRRCAADCGTGFRNSTSVTAACRDDTGCRVPPEVILLFRDGDEGKNRYESLTKNSDLRNSSPPGRLRLRRVKCVSIINQVNLGLSSRWKKVPQVGSRGFCLLLLAKRFRWLKKIVRVIKKCFTLISGQSLLLAAEIVNFEIS